MKSYKQRSYQSLMYPRSPWAKSEEERAQMTISCHDADSIPRVKNAGQFSKIDGTLVQIMHNGLAVKRNGYQGEWQAKIISQLKGIHEPQEEKVFYEVLKRIDPSGTMIELGSWWSYYSMWFLKEVPKSTAICCEPDPLNLELGKVNMRLNRFQLGRQVIFYHAASGDADQKKIKFQNEDKSIVTVLTRTVDSIIEERKLKKIDILHLDIQGFEVEALKGAQKSIAAGNVRFLFVSTHHYSISGDPIIHQKVIDFVVKNGGTVIARHNILESCSGDGLVVASFDSRDKDFSVKVTLQQTDDSLFRPYEYDIDTLWKLHEKAQREKEYLSKEVAQLHSELAWKSNHIRHLETTLKEIGHLSDHIKRQIRLKMQKLTSRKS